MPWIAPNTLGLGAFGSAMSTAAMRYAVDAEAAEVKVRIVIPDCSEADIIRVFQMCKSAATVNWYSYPDCLQFVYNKFAGEKSVDEVLYWLFQEGAHLETRFYTAVHDDPILK